MRWELFWEKGKRKRENNCIHNYTTRTKEIEMSPDRCARLMRCRKGQDDKVLLFFSLLSS